MKSKLKVGNVYVSRGGLIKLPGRADPVPWGYDRVKLLEITTDHIVIQTPWKTMCIVPLDYPLVETIETVVRSEFRLENNYISCEIIPFDEAIKRGICKELTENELPSKVMSKPKNTAQDTELTEAVIDYFATSNTVKDAAGHFGVKYQKIRYILKQIGEKGYGAQRFQIKMSKQGGVNAVQIIKV